MKIPSGKKNANEGDKGKKTINIPGLRDHSAKVPEPTEGLEIRQAFVLYVEPLPQDKSKKAKAKKEKTAAEKDEVLSEAKALGREIALPRSTAAARKAKGEISKGKAKQEDTDIDMEESSEEDSSEEETAEGKPFKGKGKATARDEEIWAKKAKKAAEDVQDAIAQEANALAVNAAREVAAAAQQDIEMHDVSSDHGFNDDEIQAAIAASRNFPADFPTNGSGSGGVTYDGNTSLIVGPLTGPVAAQLTAVGYFGAAAVQAAGYIGAAAAPVASAGTAVVQGGGVANFRNPHHGMVHQGWKFDSGDGGNWWPPMLVDDGQTLGCSKEHQRQYPKSHFYTNPSKNNFRYGNCQKCFVSDFKNFHKPPHRQAGQRKQKLPVPAWL